MDVTITTRQLNKTAADLSTNVNAQLGQTNRTLDVAAKNINKQLTVLMTARPC
jgi:hypothetical protein